MTTKPVFLARVQTRSQEWEAGQKPVHGMCPKTGVGVGGEGHMGPHWIPAPSKPRVVLVTEKATTLGEGPGADAGCLDTLRQAWRVGLGGAAARTAGQ